MVIVNRRCVNSVSTDAFEICSQEEISESGGNSWCRDDPRGRLTVILGLGQVCR